MIENCFIKQPKELAYEEVETNFGFYALLNPESSESGKEKEKEKEKEASKSEEKLLSSLLHRESKQAAETPKYFAPKDVAPLVPQFGSLLNNMIKLLDPKTTLAKGIEKAEIILLISKLVRLGNEEIHTFVIKLQIIDKTIVWSLSLNPLLATSPYNRR